MTHVKYIRSRPWRARGPWFGNRAGPRRRGYRDDELQPVAGDFGGDGADLVISVESEAVAADDLLLLDAPPPSMADGMLAARVDLSGLRAIAARGAEPNPIEVDQDTVLGPDWFALTEPSDDASLSRYSA